MNRENKKKSYAKGYYENVVVCCTVENLPIKHKCITAQQCIRKQVSFEFRQCGTHFIKDGKQYRLQTKDLCSQARKANIDYHGTGKERVLR